MCNPIVAMAAITVAQAGAQFMEQSSQAEAQKDYQARLADERQEQIAENYRRTIEAYNTKSSGELSKLEETQQTARGQEFDIRREAIRSQASSLSAAAQTGASGQSLYVGLLDSLAQAGFDISRLGVNVGLEARQSQRNLEAYRIEARDRATSIQPYTPSPITGPSGIGAALTIAGGALGAYNQFQAPTDRATALTQTSVPRVTPISSAGRFTT